MSAPAARRRSLLGETFLHPALDYLVIGGGLSLGVGLVVLLRGDPGSPSGGLLLAIGLATSSAHFGASSIRLYAKPGALRDWPFVCLGLPLAAIGVLSLAIAAPGIVGRHLQSLYLTWLPFHYATQAYGLASIYCLRSGCRLGPGDRRVLYWICLLPFLRSLLTLRGAGLDWVLPIEWIASVPELRLAYGLGVLGLGLLAPALPFLVYARWFQRGAPMPLISLLVVVANGIWWILFPYLHAFLWATIFHGIQYLAIAAIFHVREQLERPGNARGALPHALRFYAASIALGYGLFHLWPWAYVAAGFGLAESMLLVIAAIHVHHFIVDGCIWHLERDPGNRSLVEAGRAPA